MLTLGIRLSGVGPDIASGSYSPHPPHRAVGMLLTRR